MVVLCIFTLVMIVLSWVLAEGLKTGEMRIRNWRYVSRIDQPVSFWVHAGAYAAAVILLGAIALVRMWQLLGGRAP